jgi:uncharacterized protein (DUF433 family)
MSIAIQADPVPLRMDETGTIRVGGTRVTLDVLLEEHQLGATPEQIAEAYDTLSLPDVYAAIGYYLRHTGEIDAYLAQRREDAARLRRIVEEGHDRRGLRERLEARRKEGG